MTRSGRVWTLFSLCFALQGVAAGQAMLENALGTAAGAGTASTTRSVGNSVGGIARSIESLGRPSPTAVSVAPASSRPRAKLAPVAQPRAAEAAVPAPSVAKPAVPEPVYEDAAAIRTGMSGEELIRRFGPPVLAVSGPASAMTLSYSGKTSVIQLEVKDQKVGQVMSTTRHQSAIVLPGRS